MATSNKMDQARGSHWLITINNPSEEDRTALQNIPKYVKRIKFQDEVGAQGTLHVQGYIHTEQVRASAIKKWLTRAHIEVARNPQAAINYVEKTETAVPGTQVDHKNSFVQQTMIDNLLKLVDPEQTFMLKRFQELQKEHAQSAVDNRPCPPIDLKKIYEQEYWVRANQIILENPDLVQVYTQPTLMRAWLNLREVIFRIFFARNPQPTDSQTASQNELITPDEDSAQ